MADSKHSIYGQEGLSAAGRTGDSSSESASGNDGAEDLHSTFLARGPLALGESPGTPPQVHSSSDPSVSSEDGEQQKTASAMTATVKEQEIRLKGQTGQAGESGGLKVSHVKQGGGGSGSVSSRPVLSPLSPNVGLPSKPSSGLPRNAGAAPVAHGPGYSGGGNTMSALYLSDMHWWTSDQHIKKICEHIGVPVELRDISFSEHKVNGKSKGTVYIEFGSAERAVRVKNWLESNDFQNKRMSAQLSFGGTGRNPFQTLPKEPANRESRGQRQVSGASSGGGAAPASVQSSPRQMPTKPPHQHHQHSQRSQSHHQSEQNHGQHYQQPRQSQAQQGSPPPPPSAMAMPFVPGGLDPATMEMMSTDAYGGTMYGHDHMMGGHSAMPIAYPGDFATAGAYNPALYDSGVGMGGMSEGLDDGHTKRTRVEG